MAMPMAQNRRRPRSARRAGAGGGGVLSSSDVGSNPQNLHQSLLDLLQLFLGNLAELFHQAFLSKAVYMEGKYFGVCKETLVD